MTKISLIAELEGHLEKCWSVAWNPKRRLIATSSGDTTVRIYGYRRRMTNLLDEEKNNDTKKYEFWHIATLQGQHTRTVRSVAWHPDGNMLATAGFDSLVAIWMETDVEEGDDDDNDDNIDEGEGGKMEGMEGQLVPTQSTKQWECVSALEGHENEVKCVSWSANGNFLATCGRDKSVWIWEMMMAPDLDFECVTVLMEHSQDVKCVCWHPTEEFLASCSYDDTIRLYVCEPSSDDWVTSHILPPPTNTHTHTHTHNHDDSSTQNTSKGHIDTVWGISFSPSGKHLVSCSADCTLKIWSQKNLEYDRQHDISTGGFRIGKSERETWPCIRTFGGKGDIFDRALYSTDWSNNGIIGACGQDGKIVLWKTGKESADNFDIEYLTEIEDAHGVHDINSISFCRFSFEKNDDMREGEEDDNIVINDTQNLFATAGDDGKVKIWYIST